MTARWCRNMQHCTVTWQLQSMTGSYTQKGYILRQTVRSPACMSKAQVRSQRFVFDKVALRQIFSQYCRFPSHYHSTNDPLHLYLNP
jgi:hypothetical protein